MESWVVMATRNELRRMALALPDTKEGDDGLGYSVRNGQKWKSFVWTWNERVDPKKPRVPRPDVLVLRVADLQEKEALLASDADVFFTEPHYDGYRAVLVRLGVVGKAQLRELLTDAWRCQAPRSLVKEFDAK
jgi:hypothetical protein